MGEKESSYFGEPSTSITYNKGNEYDAWIVKSSIFVGSVNMYSV